MWRRIRMGWVWVWVRTTGGGRDRECTGSSEAGDW